MDQKQYYKQLIELKSPVILGVSEGAAKYMGGFKTVMAMVRELDAFYNVTVPVAVHPDPWNL